MLIDVGHSLTENQKLCLRLVAKGMTSKEIAKGTGLSPQTVDTYLKNAMNRLGAPTRRDAARMLIAYELSQELGSPTPSIVSTPAVSDLEAAAASGGWLDHLKPPPIGGRFNDLGPAQKIIAVLKIAALSAAVVFALTLFLAGLMETFR